MKVAGIEQAARELAAANAMAEPTISRVHWFPSPDEIRLVEVDTESLRSDDPAIQAFYFAPVGNVPFPSAVALIHPDEEGRKPLPPEWAVGWKDGRVVFERGRDDGK